MPTRNSCKTCVGRFFGILGSQIFFLALLAMCIAVFTMRWSENSIREQPVNGILTDADFKFGIFDLSARVSQRGQVVWNSYSYTWCNDKEAPNPGAPWTHTGTYCGLLQTAQVCAIICLAFGLTAGVIASFLSAGVITNKHFRDVACASSFFMLVEFLTSLIVFACWFGINSKINDDLDSQYPGLSVKPSYSVAMAVLCCGLVLFGFITTSALGNCGKGMAYNADDEGEEDEEVGTRRAKAGSHKKVPPPQKPVPQAPMAPSTLEPATAEEVKETTPSAPPATTGATQ